MTQFFAKKLNKKGFTLAELLIVIAIIAILVAIAIPIFTSELNKAKIARDKANIRAVKAAACAVILGQDNLDLSGAKTWYATASFTGTGASDTGDADFTITSISSTGPASNNTPGSIDYDVAVVIEITGHDLSGITVS